MIRTLALTLLTVLCISSCNECNVNPGNYTSSGGSEQNTNLTLSADNSFILKHDNWQPGHYEKRDSTQSNGTWSCSKNKITLKEDNSTYSAELITVGANPLGLDANSKAIMFGANTGVDYLNKQMFYPDF